MGGSFADREAGCALCFNSLGKVFHACTPEDHEIIFTCDEDFGAAMSILAICSRLFPQIRIITFQFLNNHLHLVLCGEEDDIEAFFNTFKRRLGRHYEASGKFVNLTRLILKLFPIDSLDYARASIAYVNRNCFILNEDVTPFSYQWGAGSCFFNGALLQLYNSCRQPLTVVQLRELFHSKVADNIKPLYKLDSYVSPLSFCDIPAGERLFRSERQYFYSMAKNAESYKKIADTIAESIYYTDEDLYQVTRTLARAKYGDVKPSLLEPEAKIDLARQLAYTYHAGKKQIMRMLKINDSVLDSLLPAQVRD